MIVDLVPNLFSYTTTKPKYYAKSVLHKDSQFQYKGGATACTYICLETATYLLNGLIHHDSFELLPLISQVCKSGADANAGLGFRSCDEVAKLVPRYSKNLDFGNMLIGKLRDDECFVKMLQNMESKTVPSKQDPAPPFKQCVILTKPPETIVVFYDALNTQYPFVIFEYVLFLFVVTILVHIQDHLSWTRELVFTFSVI
jgi:hypothetical protein